MRRSTSFNVQLERQGGSGVRLARLDGMPASRGDASRAGASTRASRPSACVTAKGLNTKENDAVTQMTQDFTANLSSKFAPGQALEHDCFKWNLTLRSHAERGVSKGGPEYACCHPSRRGLQPLLRVRTFSGASSKEDHALVQGS